MSKRVKLISALAVVVLLALGYYFYTTHNTKQVYYQVSGTVKTINADVYTLVLPDNLTELNFITTSEVTVFRRSLAPTSINDVIVGSKIKLFTTKPPLSLKSGDVYRIEVL